VSARARVERWGQRPDQPPETAPWVTAPSTSRTRGGRHRRGVGSLRPHCSPRGPVARRLRTFRRSDPLGGTVTTAKAHQ
jgi:hypothetical protein